MNRRVRSWPFLTAACLFLAACITLEPRELPPRPERAAIVAFALEGRISVRQSDKSYQAGINCCSPAPSARAWPNCPGMKRVPV